MYLDEVNIDLDLRNVWPSQLCLSSSTKLVAVEPAMAKPQFHSLCKVGKVDLEDSCSFLPK